MVTVAPRRDPGWLVVKQPCMLSGEKEKCPGLEPSCLHPHTQTDTHSAAKCVYATITQSLILQSAGSQFRQSMFQLTYFSWEPTVSGHPGDKQTFFCPAADLLDIVAPSQLCLLWLFFYSVFSLMAAQEAVTLIWTDEQWNGKRKKKTKPQYNPVSL